MKQLVPFALLVIACGCVSSEPYRLVGAYGGGIVDLGIIRPSADIQFTPRVRRLTDADVARLLPALQDLRTIHLSLYNSDVGDDALRAIREVRTLRTLDVTGTRVTPEGVRQLKGMPTLTRIWVDKADFSHGDVERLRSDLLGVAVVRTRRPRRRPADRSASGACGGRTGYPPARRR